MLRNGITCIAVPEPLVHPDGAIATALLLKEGHPVRQERVLLAEDREQLGALEGLLYRAGPLAFWQRQHARVAGHRLINQGCACLRGHRRSQGSWELESIYTILHLSRPGLESGLPARTQLHRSRLLNTHNNRHYIIALKHKINFTEFPLQ